MTVHICLPAYRGLSRPMIELAAELKFRDGWEWPEPEGHSHVGTTRNVMASNFLLNSQAEWTFWGDDDMAIAHDDVLAALRYANNFQLDVVNIAAVPGRFGANTIAADLTDTDLDVNSKPCLHFGGERGRHYRARSIGFGLVFVRRSVFERLADSYAPRCVLGFRGGVPRVGWEFFPSGVHVGAQVEVDGERLPSCAGEDYGFSALCQRAGIPLHVLTKYRCFHYHSHAYSWEDAWTKPKRAQNLTVTL